MPKVVEYIRQDPLAIQHTRICEGKTNYGRKVYYVQGRANNWFDRFFNIWITFGGNDPRLFGQFEDAKKYAIMLNRQMKLEKLAK